MKRAILALINLLFATIALAQPASGGYCPDPPPPAPPLTFYGTICNSPSTNDLIDNFWTTGGITNISNLNSGCNFMPNNYQNVPQILTTTPGTTINFNVQCGATYQQGFAIWIDWNQDFDFNDPGEKIYESPSAGFQVFTGSFTVPANATCGNYRLRVRSNFAVGGANITPCDQQTYGETEDYTVTLTNCSSQERTICEGETATIDYTSTLPPTSPITVVVSPMTNVNISIPTIDFNPLDSAVYLVTWTSPDSTWQDTAKIHVNDPLLPTYAGLNDSVCDGNIVALQATPANSGTDYQWFAAYPGPNISAGFFPFSNTTGTNMLNGTPGVAYAIFVESDTLGICPSVSDTATIVFSEELHATVKADPTCNGYADGQITINSFGTLGAVEYSINNGGTWSTSNVFTGLSAGFYDIMSRDIIGCTFSSTVTLVDPDEVTISTVNDTTVCENGTASLVATSTNGQFFNWNFTPSLSANQSINPTTDSTITVFATNLANCSSDTLTVQVTMYDPIQISITADDTICPGDLISVTVSPTGGYQGYDFGWSANGGGTNFVGPTINVTPNEVTNYCVSVSDGCESTPKSLCSEVAMRPVPTTTFISTVLEKCVPAKVKFDLTTPGYLFGTAAISIGGQKYIINNNGSGLPPSITHTFPDVGDYDFYLKMTSPYGCINDTTAFKEVTSFPIPEPDFYLSPEKATIFQPAFEIINLTKGANNNYDWTLLGGDPVVSSETNPSVVYPDGEPNKYPIKLVVTSDQNCIDSLTIFAEVVNDIVIYAPNSFTPNEDNYNETWRIFIEGIIVYDYHLQIFNRWGEIVFESFDPDAEWDGKLANGDNVPGGTYVWLVKAKDVSSSEVFDYRGTINIFR